MPTPRTLWIIPVEDNATASALLATHTTRKASLAAMNERIAGNPKKDIKGYDQVLIPMNTRPDWHRKITQSLDATARSRMREGSAVENPTNRVDCVLTVMSAHPAQDPEWHFID